MLFSKSTDEDLCGLVESEIQLRNEVRDTTHYTMHYLPTTNCIPISANTTSDYVCEVDAHLEEVKGTTQIIVSVFKYSDHSNLNTWSIPIRNKNIPFADDTIMEIAKCIRRTVGGYR